MEFSADIKFSSTPMENKELTITYSGYLFKNNSNSLTIVYGFGDNWMYTNEQKMEKTENGFVANIKMLNFSKFNFCFKNENNFWDNNYNSNFIAPIEEFHVEDENFVLNENVAEEIITNLVEYDVSETPEAIAESNIEDNSFEVYVEQNENIDISETIVNITSEDNLNENLNKAFLEFYEGAEEVNKINEDQNNNSSSQVFDINEFSDLFEDFEEESIFDDYYKMSDNVENIKDNTVDNVVSDIIDDLYEESKNNEPTESIKPAHISLDAKKVYKYGEETALVVSPRSLGKFYSFKKRMKIAVYKFFSVIPKLLNGEFSEENNK